jgi:hypothetical protein
MHSLFSTPFLLATHANACRWSCGAEVQVGGYQEVTCWSRGRARLFVAEASRLEECLSGCLCRFVQGSWDAVKSSVTQNAAQCALTTPSTLRCDCDHASHIVLIVVNVQSEWTIEELLYRISLRSQLYDCMLLHLQ